MAERKKKSAALEPNGADVLAHVRALVVERANTPERAPRRAEIDREARAIRPPAAIAALEAWLEQHRAWLVVRRGAASDAAQQLAAAHGKLHTLHRLLLGAFGGFLEVSIDPARWPHLRHGDGFRVLGVAPEYAACDLTAQLARYHATVDAALDLYKNDVAKQKSLNAARAMLPLLTTLEGVADAWIASQRTIDWLADRRIASPPRREAPTHPRIGAPFALVARLIALEARLAQIERWITVAELVGRVEPVRFDARGELRLVHDPFVAMTFAHPPGSPSLGTLVVRAELAKIPSSQGVVEPLFQRKMHEADVSLHGATVHESLIHVLWARVDLLRDGLSVEEIHYALALVRHARARFADPSRGDFDPERQPIPAAIEALLRARRSDAAGFAERLAASKLAMEPAEVLCVGRAHPRIRWSCTPRRPPHFAGHSHLQHTQLWHAVEQDGAPRYEAELSCAALTDAHVDALMSTLTSI